MLDIKCRFTCGDSDLSEVIKKCQNIMTRIVAVIIDDFIKKVVDGARANRVSRVKQCLHFLIY